MNYWNSTDHPNCINVFVSATPWNLQTTKSRFDKSIRIGFNKTINKYVFYKSQMEGRSLTKKSSLFDIRWSACTQEFNNGRKVKFLVSNNLLRAVHFLRHPQIFPMFEP